MIELPGALSAHLTAVIAAATAAAVVVALGWMAVTIRRLKADLQRSRESLAVQRSVDPVTGLSTPEAFDHALDLIAEQCDQRGVEACLLVLEIDDFHLVHDAFGGTAAEQALVEFGKRLQTLSEGRYPCARLDGKTFGLAVAGPTSKGTEMAGAVARELAKPIDTPNGSLRLTGSIGIVNYPGQPRRALLEKATLALKDAKDRGRGGHAVHDPASETARRSSARTMHDLRGALERNELFLQFQPKIDAKSLLITAAEVLVRWRHPVTGVVSPDRFIPMAEQYGLIEPIGRWVIEEACRQAAAWREKGMRMRIAVNISGDQLRQSDFCDHLTSCLRRHGIPPERFTCEITESIAMADTEVTRAAFEQLRALGVHVSIDDFGTGHSSLASLKRLPAAELKIDRAFVTDLVTSEHAQFIAETIVKMAHALNLRVVAEGVENRQQRDILVAMGCDELQGYLFAKPMMADELGMWSAQQAGNQNVLFRPSIFAETTPGTPG